MEVSGTALRTNKLVMVADSFGFRTPVRLLNGCFDQWMSALEAGTLEHRVVFCMNHGKDANGLLAADDSETAPLAFEVVESGPDEVLQWSMDIPEGDKATDAQRRFLELKDQGLLIQVSAGWNVKRYEWLEEERPDGRLVMEQMEIDPDEVAAVWQGAFGADSVINRNTAPGDHRKRAAETPDGDTQQRAGALLDGEPATVPDVDDNGTTRVEGTFDGEDIRIEGSHMIGAWDARASMEAARKKMRAAPPAPEAKIIDADTVDAVMADTGRRA